MKLSLIFLLPFLPKFLEPDMQASFEQRQMQALSDLKALKIRGDRDCYISMPLNKNGIPIYKQTKASPECDDITKHFGGSLPIRIKKNDCSFELESFRTGVSNPLKPVYLTDNPDKCGIHYINNEGSLEVLFYNKNNPPQNGLQYITELEQEFKKKHPSKYSSATGEGGYTKLAKEHNNNHGFRG